MDKNNKQLISGYKAENNYLRRENSRFTSLSLLNLLFIALTLIGIVFGSLKIYDDGADTKTVSLLVGDLVAGTLFKLSIGLSANKIQKNNITIAQNEVRIALLEQPTGAGKSDDSTTKPEGVQNV